MIAIDKKDFIIIVLTGILIAVCGYMLSGGAESYNDRDAINQIRDSLSRIEKRNSDLETKLQRISDTVDRSLDEIADSRKLVGEIADRNQRSIEASGRAEDRISELEAIAREIREANTGKNKTP